MRADEKSGEGRSPLHRLLHVLIRQADFWVHRDHAGEKQNSVVDDECFLSASMNQAHVRCAGSYSSAMNCIVATGGEKRA